MKRLTELYLLSSWKCTGMNNESRLLNNKFLHVRTVQLHLLGLQGKFHYNNFHAVCTDVKDMHTN